MRTTATRFFSLVVLSATAALPLAAQQGPRALPAPDKEFDEPFSSVGVGALRELRDGRVIIADPRDKVVSLVDFRTGSATTIGREGSGPQEFGMPLRVYGAPGDTTYLFDPLNSRYLLIGPDGKPINTFRTEADPTAGRQQANVMQRPGAAPSGGAAGAAGSAASGAAGRAAGGAAGSAPAGAVRRTAGGGGAFVMGGTTIGRATDARGRIYAEGSALSIGEDGQPKTADSVAIIRFDRGTQRLDTLAYVKLAASNTQIQGSGSNNMRVMVGGANPLAPRDEWAVFPDGRVAIVRANTYHVDFIMPDGTKRSGQRIAYTPVRMNAAEIRHEEGLRNAARANQMSIQMNNNNGNITRSATMGPGANAQPLEPLTDWPDVKPPFRSGMSSVLARPNGELWVRRTENAQARGTLYDVITPQGTVAFQVRIQDGWTLVGFGANTIYTTRKDEDDLVYLQRHPATEQSLRGDN
jgi:hypothetical protein